MSRHVFRFSLYAYAAHPVSPAHLFFFIIFFFIGLSLTLISSWVVCHIVATLCSHGKRQAIIIINLALEVLGYCVWAASAKRWALDLELDFHFHFDFDLNLNLVIYELYGCCARWLMCDRVWIWKTLAGHLRATSISRRIGWDPNINTLTQIAAACGAGPLLPPSIDRSLCGGLLQVPRRSAGAYRCL